MPTLTQEELSSISRTLQGQEVALEAFIKQTRSLMSLSRSLAGRTLDAAEDPLWTRMPGKADGRRCRYSSFSGRYLYSLIKAGKVRSKKANAHARYYSAADVLKFIEEQEP